MAAAQENAAEVECVPPLKHTAPLSLPDFQHCSSHVWASTPANNFFVRGPHYLETKAKVPSGEPLLQPIAFDLIKSSSKISNIMKHPECRVRAALCTARQSANVPASRRTGVADGECVQKPFVWAFNLQLPSKENHSVVMYYVSFHSPEEGSLMQRFLNGDDTFRTDRLKMLTNIAQGPRIVKLAVGEKGGAVAMIGKTAQCTYLREEDYMEVDVDLGCSMLACAGFQLCVGFAAHMTVEFAFVLEGRCPLELPERIVGAMRLANVDFSSALSIDCPSHEPVVKEKQKASYKRLWKYLSKGGHQDVDHEREKHCATGDL